MTAQEFAKTLSAKSRIFIWSELKIGPLIFVQQEQGQSWWLFTPYSVHQGVNDVEAYLKEVFGRGLSQLQQRDLNEKNLRLWLLLQFELPPAHLATCLKPRAIELFIEHTNVLGVESVK